MSPAASADSRSPVMMLCFRADPSGAARRGAGRIAMRQDGVRDLKTLRIFTPAGRRNQQLGRRIVRNFLENVKWTWSPQWKEIRKK